LPFTFSHPALILPILRLPYISVSGLIAGSMTPDFEYFLRMTLGGRHGHTLPGLFYFDLPVGLILIFVYHLLVKIPLVHNLPPFLNRRLRKFNSFQWLPYFKKNWVVVIASILIGAGSHIFWDSFTHNSGFFVERFPGLRLQVYFFGEDHPVWHVLQHLSSAVGLIVITVWLMKFKKDSTCDPVQRKFWIYFLSLMIIIFTVRMAYYSIEIKIGHVVVIFIAAALYSLILTSLTVRSKYYPINRDSIGT
jgi:hypothetical protein